MATQAQIEANRRNSQRSTGPRTEAGKAASSKNALAWGLYAHALVIEGEDPAALVELAREYEEDCRPVGPRERAVVDTLVHTDWILRRIRAVEAAVYNHYLADVRRAEGQDYDRASAFSHMAEYLGPRLDRVQRRLASLDRAYHQALADLKRLQADRNAAEPVPAPQTAPPAGEIGFVPPNPPTAVSASRREKTPPPKTPDPPPPCATMIDPIALSRPVPSVETVHTCGPLRSLLTACKIR